MSKEGFGCLVEEDISSLSRMEKGEVMDPE